MTGGLLAALERPGGLIAGLRGGAPEAARLRVAVERIAPREGRARPMQTIAAIQAAARAAVEAGRVHDLSRRDLREAAAVFFLKPDPPAANPKVAAALLDAIAGRQHRGAILALIDAYLIGFDADDPGIHRAAAWLERQALCWAWRERDPWPGRTAAWALCRPAEAPLRIGRACLDQDDPTRALAEAGLDTEQRRRGGLAQAAFRAACAAVAEAPAGRAVALQRRLGAWAEGPDGRALMTVGWSAFAVALLRPWIAAEPAAEHRAWVTDTLLLHGEGDPRTKPLRWREIEPRHPDCYAVLIRWLTEASVKQFLEIVDRSLTSPEERRMWAYRKAFWLYYLNRDDGGPRIDAAWVALGDEGQRIAREAARQTNDRSFLNFGRTDRSAKHSALIARIGDLTIADWSHSGCWNIWERGDADAPSLFAQSYRWRDLDGAPLGTRGSHTYADRFNWQKKVASIIERRPIFSERPAWMPRRAV